MKKLSLALGLALCPALLAAAEAPSPAATPVAAAVEAVVAAPSPTATPFAAPLIKVSGLLKHQLIGVEGQDRYGKKDRTVVEGGSKLKNMRANFTAKPAEYASAFIILDGVDGTLRLVEAWGKLTHKDSPATLTLGIFKFPFGMNRHYGAGALRSIDGALMNASVLGGDTYDNGAMLTVKGGPVTFDAAVIDGRGTTLPSSGTRGSQDFSGTLKLDLGAVTLGGSVYQGTRGTLLTEPVVMSDAFLKAKLGFFSLEAEAMNNNRNCIGYYVEPMFALGKKVDLIGTYDRVENFLNASLGSGKIGGGLRWKHIPPLTMTLWAYGSSSGPDQTPKSFTSVLQTQLEY